jgi:mannosyltransferase
VLRAVRDRSKSLLVALVLVAAVVRFVGLGRQSYWYDESFTVHLVRGDVGDLLSSVADNESTPPLYFVLAWGWSRLFGSAEVGLRSLSALLGTALVVIAWAAGRRIGGTRAAVAAAALVAVNPFLVWYSQEARAYALLAFAAGLSVLVFLAAARRPAPGWLVAWAATSVVAVAAHYFAIAIVLPEAVWLVAVCRPRRPVLLACAPILAACLALAPLALEQRSSNASLAIGPNDLVHRAGAIPKQFLLGASAAQIDAVAVVGFSAVIAGVLAVVVARSAAVDHANRLLLAVAGAALTLPLLLALVGLDYVNPRNLIAVLFPLLLSVAAAVAHSRVAVAGAVALCALGIAINVAVATTPRLQRDDWRSAARAMATSPRLPQAIVLEPAGGRPPLSVYLPEVREPEPGRMTVREVWAMGLKRPPGPSPAAPPGGAILPGPLRSTGSYLLRRYSVRRNRPVDPASLAAQIFPGSPVTVLVR